jgi:glycerophosphodiester phosphodiesterase
MGVNRLYGGAVLPEFRENTVKSFVRAAELGASFVELDVQVTSDRVPVIWHDNIMLHGSPSAPSASTISDLTYSDLQAIQPSLLRYFSDSTGYVRELSSWVVEEDDTLPTLEMVLNALPEHVAVNIEVKMTTPDDIAQTSAEEIDRVLSAVVPVINASSHSTRRTILLSSFDPDVCDQLRRRMPDQPVMFLSDGGADPHADPRRQSLASALDVATEFDLDGVVLDTDMLRLRPEIVKLAAIQGLKVLTYGRANDEPEWVLQQAQLGVHAAIVDDVLRVVASTKKASTAVPCVEFARSML